MISSPPFSSYAISPLFDPFPLNHRCKQEGPFICGSPHGYKLYSPSRRAPACERLRQSWPVPDSLGKAKTGGGQALFSP
jgi:hypothetical protein